MEVRTGYPIKQYEQFERHEPVVLDNSAISEYKRCPRAYFYRYVLGFDTTANPPYFLWGTAYHKFRELLEIEYTNNRKTLDISTSISLSIAVALVKAIEYWNQLAIKNPPDYAESPRAKFNHLNLANFKLACESILKYWSKEKESGNVEVLATEQPIRVQLPNGEWYGGRADQVIRANGKVRGRDFKTTTKIEMYYTRSFTPNAQFAGYTYAEGIIHGSPIRGQTVEVLYGIQPGLKKPFAPVIKPYIVDFTSEQIEEWLQGTMEVMEQMKVSRENDFYRMNENACTFCPFHDVCRMPNETSRVSVLKNKYKVSVWDHSEED